MEPLWITTIANVVTMLLVLLVPVILIGLGVSLGLRLVRGESPQNLSHRTYDNTGRMLLAVVAIGIGVLWLFLSFGLGVRPGESPFLVILPVLLVLLVQIGFWVLIIAGAVLLVLWLARRLGVVGPAHESPLDILKARYARGELSTEQYEEMKQRLGDA